MTKVMNVAMIGGGFMGKAHAMAYASMPMFFWPAPASTSSAKSPLPAPLRKPAQ
jgi:predicted dehydrogenase